MPHQTNIGVGAAVVVWWYANGHHHTNEASHWCQQTNKHRQPAACDDNPTDGESTDVGTNDELNSHPKPDPANGINRQPSQLKAKCNMTIMRTAWFLGHCPASLAAHTISTTLLCFILDTGGFAHAAHSSAIGKQLRSVA